MGFFKKREQTISPSLVDSLAQALSKAFENVLTSQSQQIQQTSQFLGVMQDLSAKKAAQVMGQRGGRVTQERKRQAKAARKGQVQCVLCADPMHRGTTLEQIAFHRLHEGGSGQNPVETSGNPIEEVGN